MGDNLNDIGAIISALSRKTSSGANQFDIPLSALIGVLTDTYTPPAIGKSDDELLSLFAPSIFEVASGQIPADDPRFYIVQEVLNGTPLMDIHNLVRELVAKEELSSEVDPKFLSDELIKFANSVHAENIAYKKESRANEQFKLENDPFRKAGLPGPEERYNPVAMYPAIFDQIAQTYTKRRTTNENLENLPTGEKTNPKKDLEKVYSDIRSGLSEITYRGKTYNPVQARDQLIPQLSELISREQELKSGLKIAQQELKQAGEDFFSKTIGVKGQGAKTIPAKDKTGEGLAAAKKKVSDIETELNTLSFTPKSPLKNPGKWTTPADPGPLYSDTSVEAGAKMAQFVADYIAQRMGSTPLKDALINQAVFSKFAVKAKKDK